jgi:hypothetical protein
MEFEAAETPAARFGQSVGPAATAPPQRADGPPLAGSARRGRRPEHALPGHRRAAYLAEGRARAGRVGAADAVLASAGDLVPFASSYLAGALGLSSGRFTRPTAADPHGRSARPSAGSSPQEALVA